MKIDRTWTLFLDRDGVINNHPKNYYVHRWSEFEFMPGVLEALKVLRDRFIRICVVTNQQGVGKGLMTMDDLQHIHENMLVALAEIGVDIDAVYACTDLAEKENNCRKPSPKMAYYACQEFEDIDLSKSIMIGDQPSDIEFGKNANMHTVHITNLDSMVALENDMGADYTFNSLLEFTNYFFNE